MLALVNPFDDLTIEGRSRSWALHPRNLYASHVGTRRPPPAHLRGRRQVALSRSEISNRQRIRE